MSNHYKGSRVKYYCFLFRKRLYFNFILSIALYVSRHLVTLLHNNSSMFAFALSTQKPCRSVKGHHFHSLVKIFLCQLLLVYQCFIQRQKVLDSVFMFPTYIFSATLYSLLNYVEIRRGHKKLLMRQARYRVTV